MARKVRRDYRWHRDSCRWACGRAFVWMAGFALTVAYGWIWVNTSPARKTAGDDAGQDQQLVSGTSRALLIGGTVHFWWIAVKPVLAPQPQYSHRAVKWRVGSQAVDAFAPQPLQVDSANPRLCFRFYLTRPTRNSTPCELGYKRGVIEPLLVTDTAEIKTISAGRCGISSHSTAPQRYLRSGFGSCRCD